MTFYNSNNLRNKFSKNSGFSLVEVMIAAAALGGLAVVGMQMTKTLTKSNAKASFDSETTLITNEIVSILSDPNKCLVTLGGKNAISTTSGINNINGSKYYSAASGNAPVNGYGNAGLSIASYAISATASEVSANNSSLLINYQNKNILKGSAGLSTITKKINLYVEVDGSNNITTCRSLSSSSADIWTRGSGNKIYYNGGNVGVGTNNPITQLDVAGGVKFGNETQVTTCDAANEGVQRYNKTTHSFEYCAYSSGPPVSYAWSNIVSGLGFNQEWKRMDTSRALNQGYANSTNKPIEVSVMISGKYPNSIGYWGFAAFVMDQNGIYQQVVYQLSTDTSTNVFGSTGTLSATFVVPPNRMYKVSPTPQDGSTARLSFWYELR